MKLTDEQSTELLQTLKIRFEANPERHKGIVWSDVEKKLAADGTKLWSLFEMERTGGEPDVVGQESGGYIFFDCSPQSPQGRRNLCYDDEALEARKKFKPEGSAAAMASQMGISLLTEEEYRFLQTLGEYDTKTSSWIQTPDDIRALGGALFADYRYGQAFVYHNGADSYYSARGFRGSLRV